MSHTSLTSEALKTPGIIHMDLKPDSICQGSSLQGVVIQPCSGPSSDHLKVGLKIQPFASTGDLEPPYM